MSDYIDDAAAAAAMAVVSHPAVTEHDMEDLVCEILNAAMPAIRAQLADQIDAIETPEAIWYFRERAAWEDALEHAARLVRSTSGGTS